jgi:pyruvate/2-oxoglutarate/acetoin dehydrogenase E1 component
MVLRAPFGGGIHAPEHHSESPEAMFAHIPGLRVVIPSSPARASWTSFTAASTLALASAGSLSPDSLRSFSAA